MTIPSLPQNYNFLEREKHWQRFWETQALYSWDPTSPRADTFVVDTPPPTVSGQLHIGHTCSYAQADFIVRFQRMLGKNIFYPMGFDDNGLPTERLVEKQKGIRAANMDRADFVKLCQEVVRAEEEKFRHLFKAMALSVDWSLEYQTISPLSRRLAQLSFLALLEKNQVYRSVQPILWDPVDGTALAQADVEDKERVTYMHNILFVHEATQAPLPIATTRPELLPACVALFYHPDDLRYQHLAHTYAITPIFNIRVPIVADALVQPNKGTGLVMCCTFGDQTDVVWWKKHQLPTAIILDKRGRVTHAGPLQGLKVAAAREKIIQILKEQALLVKQTIIHQSVKCAERSGAPLEILTTPQWFVRTIEHKAALLAKISQLKWYPAAMQHRLEAWVNGIAWDWCISRQRYFGVPFPVWYSKRSGEEGKILLPTLDQLPVNPLQDLPIGYTSAEVIPDYDVMDTWATSSISPQLSSHAIHKDFSVDYSRHLQLFPMDLRPQAHEIIRTWAFYTLLKAHLHEDKLPWKNIMINGWCLAPDKQKMSKSKGNVLLPDKLLETYGADVIRYWAASARLGADTCYCDNVMKNGKRLVTKLWNAGKFILSHFDKVEGLSQPLSLHALQITHTLDKWLLQSLAALTQKVHLHLLAYGYAEALEQVERFFWSVFCDDYLEISKTRVYNTIQQDDRGQSSAIVTLYHAFYGLLQLFAPILPHITEELAQGLYPHKGSIHQRGNWPKWALDTTLKLSPAQIDQVAHLREILRLVRKAKADGKLSIKAPIQLLTISGTVLEEDLKQDLQAVTAATTILFSDLTMDHIGLQVVGKQCVIWIEWG